MIITLTKPDDWHVHLREGDYLKSTVTATSNHFSRALVMPNLKKPLTSVKEINDYKKKIRACITNDFKPYFTLYLTDLLSNSELEQAKKDNLILGAKLYPAGATTNSEAGVNSIKALYPTFALMQELDLVLQIHGETTTDDIFDREALFIEKTLIPLTQNFPKLRIVLEHISTKAACDFILESSDNVAATLTIHHLMYNRNDLLAGGIKPHYYCLPILKRKSDQKALQMAAISANRKFFLGTDSAPHSLESKESSCGCAGIYSAPFAMPLYTEFFDSSEHLNKLESFSSHFGADFYQLPRNVDTITFEKSPHTIPSTLKIGNDDIVPIAADQIISWRQVND